GAEADRHRAALGRRRDRLRLGARDPAGPEASAGGAAGLLERARRAPDHDPTPDGDHALTRAPPVLPIPGPLAAPAGAPTRPRLHPFASCRALAGYARGHVGPASGPRKDLEPTVTSGTAPAPTGTGETGAPATSGTNVQEPGVDEPDVVKTDGTTLFETVDG